MPYHLAMAPNDPTGNRTRVTAVKGPCLNRLTIGPKKAPRVGFEPTTHRLTAGCSTAELSRIIKRRKWDLNPRAAINDLLPFQGSPFNHLGTSPNAFPSAQIKMAERVGFEPTAPCGVTGFQDRLLKPLGHLSTCFARSASCAEHKTYNTIIGVFCQQFF